MKTPELIPYLFSELPKSSSSSTAPESLKSQLVKRVGWLFPEEIDMIISNDTGHVNWEKGIPLLLEKVDMISTEEGGEENEKKKLASAPIGLMEDLEDPAGHSSRFRNLSLTSHLPAHVN